MREEQETKEAQQTTMMTRRHELAAEFGSKKSRKAIESMTLNAISSGKPGAPAAARTDGVADNILDNMSSAVSAMPTKADQESAIDSSKPRPKANLKAEYPSDVYTIDTVVGTELMTMIDIKDWVDACASNKGVNVTSRYVAKRIAKLAKNKQMQKLKVLRFILLCINFNAALQGSGGSRPKKIPPMGKLELAMGRDVPAGCVMAIRRKFAAQEYVQCSQIVVSANFDSGSDMPRWNTDNLITHIAAAALIVDDLEVDVNDLRDDLKVDNKEYVHVAERLQLLTQARIRAYFSELGCKVTAPSVTDQTKWKLTKAEAYNHYIAKLKLPLSFPKLGMHRARK
jgi:DNA-directed RNA polymerase I subunit RPA49